jgi:hypothetical protein
MISIEAKEARKLSVDKMIDEFAQGRSERGGVGGVAPPDGS